eukprot:23077-Hanusia_phi.AAC.3
MGKAHRCERIGSCALASTAVTVMRVIVRRCAATSHQRSVEEEGQGLGKEEGAGAGADRACTCHVRPSFPPFPEPLVRLICPEDEEDREKPPDELVRPLWDLEQVAHVPVVRGQCKDE